MSFQEIQMNTRLLPGAAELIVNTPPEYLELMWAIKLDIQPAKIKQGKYDFVQVFGSERSMSEQLVGKY